ncbi:phage tail protein [Amylibacter sp. IMCC11727]|uniref:phage tail protein n=1 Tax=Amylibacter sp. IMCC11727 TaxID=3039851 RepID=UPI00244DE3E0|nr:phage tail protein [Amylibacter sp. IMCC11727]WGI21446.1 phage tail protein [Amylibacter sp. IMCC11727]
MSGKKQDTNWPLPKFYFSVIIGGETVSFQEVSGLDVENQTIEYRHGDSPVYKTVKMPGMQKLGNVTLKRGVFTKDNKFWDWYSKIEMNTIEREFVQIQLLDQSGKPTMTWTLDNAFPVKVSGIDLQEEGNDVAVETIEIAYEKLSVSNS